MNASPKYFTCVKFLAALLLILPLVACNSSSAPGTASTVGGATPDTEPSTMPDKITHTDAEWKKLLSPEQYSILRQKDTEAPFTGKYDSLFQPGTYYCAACGQELFSSDTKFNSGCGWPAFYAAKAGDKVKLVSDDSFGMTRTEVECSRCGSHLGHIFDDAPQTPTGQRYCINSASLKFVPFPTTEPKK